MREEDIDFHQCSNAFMRCARPTDPVVSYLRKSLDCDPDYLPAVRQLIKQYREDGDDKKWHVLADEAAPDPRMRSSSTRTAIRRLTLQ